MGNSLNLTFIKKKSRFDQCLAVTGGAGKSNLRVFRKKLIDLFDRTDGSFQRISVVVAVERVQKCSVFAYQCSFGGGGTGIDSQETFSLICRKVACFYLVGALTVVEGLIVILCGKKWLHTFYLKVQFDGGTHAFFQFD